MSSATSECKHTMMVHELCLTCGQIVHNSGSRVNVVAAGTAVSVCPDELVRLAKEKSARLKDQKKLVLVLDIDQTLLHATPDREASVIMQHTSVGHEVHALTMPNGEKHHVKLRPYLGFFLRCLAPFFQMHIYTAGTRPYADAVVQVLDPERTLISRPVVSRDECPDLSRDTKVAAWWTLRFSPLSFILSHCEAFGANPGCPASYDTDS